jgi:hypothetical protein
MMTRIQSAAIALAIAAAPLAHAEEAKEAARVSEAPAAVQPRAVEPTVEEVVRLRKTVEELKKTISDFQAQVSQGLVYVDESHNTGP